MERLYPKIGSLLEVVVDAVLERGLSPFVVGSEAEDAFDVRAAAGPNKFVAGVAASSPRKNDPGSSCVTKPGGFSLRVLRPPSRQRRKQAPPFLFGLERLGQIAELDPVAVQAQSGSRRPPGLGAFPGRDDRRWCRAAPSAPSPKALGFPRRSASGPRFGRGSGSWSPGCGGARSGERRRCASLSSPLASTKRRGRRASRCTSRWAIPKGWRRCWPAGCRGGAAGGGSAVTLKVTLLGGPYVGQEPLFPGGGQRLAAQRRLGRGQGPVRHYRPFRIAEVEPWSRIPERRYALIDFEP